MSQGRSDDDRIALLEAQLSEMQVVLEAERQRHREESQAQASKLRLLELQVREQEDRKPHKTVHAPNLSRGGPRMVASTPRTSDNLFVALPSDSRPASRGSGSVTSSSTRTASKTGLRSARGHVGGSTDATATQRTVAKTPNASPERATAAAATRSRTTALQHAWDKFCLAARGEFTTHELSLVSAETLQSLMDHYKVRSSIERAQIEGQWALLQEGKLSVGENATPKPGTTAKRAAVKRAVHTTPFDLRGELGKPHLSNRQLLGNEGVKPSNPNETTSTALVRSHSATVLLKPREPGPSNPNETQTHSEMKKLCFTRTVSPGPGRETPRGMRHVQPTESGEFTPRGIRTAGSTFMGGDEQRPHGVRCNIGGNQDGQTPRRGVRTYDSAQSPTRTHRPTIHVATPPHLDRVHLLTQTLAQNGAKRVERTTSHVERRTPFALGDN